ncbi:MAG: RecX family transcriptional regulator [Patescibacteria group bacterium]
MPEITSIKPQKNGKRLNIYLDNKFGFGIDLENFVVLGLKEGQEYCQEEINNIIKKSQFQKTLDKLLRFATLRPRSQKEIKSWLRKKEVHESLNEELFERLKHLELLDDEKFAKWWIDQRLSFRPRGKRALEYELFQKGIDRGIIGKILNESEIDETKIAKELLEKNTYKWKKYKGFEEKQKKSQFLARKGISWDSIKKLL